MTAPAPLPGTTLLVGCGYTGTRLARRLPGPVLALVRSRASAEALAAEGIAAQAVDLDLAVACLPPLPTPLAGVVYLAPPPERGTGDSRLAQCLEALGGARPGVLVYLSTTGVYGPTDGAAVDEDAPARPREDRARRRLDAEQRAAAWCAARGLRCVVLRVPAIYGPGRLPLDRLRRGEPVLREEDSGPGNRIHVDDLVAACLAALAGPVAGVVNVTDGCPESMAAFTGRVAAAAGLSLPPRITWAEAQTSLSPGLLSFLRETRVVLNHRLVRELGLRPRQPDLGIAESLAEMRAEPGPPSTAGR